MRKFLLLAALPAFLFGSVLIACGGGDDKKIDVPGGGEIQVGGDVPDDFPDDFPIYDGADVSQSYTGEQDGKQGYYVLWQTDDSVDDVKKFYEDEFESGPWKTTGTFSGGGSDSFIVENADAKKSAYVGIIETDGKTTISVFVTDDTSLSGDDSSDSGDDTPSGDDSSDSGDDSDEPTADDGDSSGDDGGSAELPDEVDLDDKYPSDKVPLPDGSRVTSNTSFSSGGTSTLYVELYVKKSVDDLEQYYKDKLEGAGYTDSFSTTSNGEVYLTYTGSDPSASESFVVSIRPSDVEGYAQVTLSITGPDE